MAMPEIPQMPTKWSIEPSDVAQTDWFERDRSNVNLDLKAGPDGEDSSVSLAAWWDEDLLSLVEDGFLDSRDWTGSGLAYLRGQGALDAVEKAVMEDLATVWQPVMEAATPAGEANHSLDIDELLHTLETTTVPRLAKLPPSLRHLVRHEADHLMVAGQLIVGYRIVDATGNVVHGGANDPFGLNSDSVLCDDAIATAREWASANPGYAVVPVQEDDLDAPQFVVDIGVDRNPVVADDGVDGQGGYDVALRIGGSIDDPRVAFSLVRAILEGDLGKHWEGSFDATDDVLDAMAAATGDGEGLVLTGKEVNSDAAMMAITVCRSAGLPYVVSIGGTGEEGYDRELAWHPGLPDAVPLFRYEPDDVDATKATFEASGDVVSRLRDLDYATWNAKDAPWFPPSAVSLTP